MTPLNNYKLRKLFEVIDILDFSQKKRLLKIQFLSLIMAFLEMMPVALIYIFMKILSFPEQINSFLPSVLLQKFIGSNNHEDLVVYAGLILVFSVLISALISIFGTYKLSLFSMKLGNEISLRLYKKYISMGWSYHTKKSSTILIKNLTEDIDRVSTFVIFPMLKIISTSLMIVFLISVVFYVDIAAALWTITFFGILYSLIFRYSKANLNENGRIISNKTSLRYLSIVETFSAMRELLLLNNFSKYFELFKNSGEEVANAKGRNEALRQIPRYIVQFSAISVMIILISFFVYDGKDIMKMSPIISLYALAGLKFLPAFQEVYYSTASIIGARHSIKNLRSDMTLRGIKDEKYLLKIHADESKKIFLKEKLQIKNISHAYEGSKNFVLNNISMSINANSTIGIAGFSGSGKSTLVDTICGLISPLRGELIVDNEIITNSNLRLWQKNIGYVSQSFFIAETSVEENIALGVDEKFIDKEKLWNAIEKAKLREFILGLEFNEKTLVGEKGVQLSGGQKQRIAIARALYHDPEVLIFDEATSALDTITEKTIMSAIQNLKNSKTIIIIAHRLKTLEVCDEIFILNNGTIEDVGTYMELKNRNSFFKELYLEK